MRSKLFALLAPLALAASPALAAHHEAPAGPQPVAEAADLVDEVAIPYEGFTLDNGLRVIVHEDRKAPVVAVSIWYHIGSRHEPEGRTGFAHLFEHLMFNGSENAPGDFFEPLRQIGATDLNGTTWYDRTNYFQTVPTAALPFTLWLESDRMGHLLGAVTQEKLDNQRGVVQNEKRQGDNQPYGLVDYEQIEILYGPDHPYGHSTIGSMADLDAASLEDVRQWFRAKYGPNNAVLVLAGDIDAATARPLVERYFGHIPRGPDVAQVDPGIPTLDGRREVVMQDQVAQTRLYRSWVVPGRNDPAAVELDIAASVFGGLASSRLDNILVREEQTATGVRAFIQPFEYNSQFEIQVDVAPDADADAVAERLDGLIADFIANGPTEDEVDRVAMTQVTGRIAGLEQVGGFGGKAVVLAQGELYSDDPGYYRTELERYGAATPESVTEAMQRWLTRPVLALRVVPGEREAYEEAGSVAGERTGGLRSPAFYHTPGIDMAFDNHEGAGGGEASELTRPQPRPEIGEIGDLDFPDVERATLANGIGVVFAHRDTVPRVHVSLRFDAGYAADPREKLGLQSLMANLMDEGTTTLDSTQIAEARERLGAAITTGASLDRTGVGMTALTPNLAPSLDLLADIVKNPAFAEREIERVRAQRIAGIASELTQPLSIALRNLPPLLYGDAHPYGIPFTGSGTAETVAAITRADIVDAHRRWIRPDTARIFVVGDTSLAEILPMLEARFGDWAPPEMLAGVKRFPETAPEPQPRIVLIDRPQSPQSIILAGTVLPVAGTDDLVLLRAANEALGGDFLSRLNMDLRETKGWAYGAFGFLSVAENEFPYIVYAPVQADRTGDSVAAIIDQYGRFLGDEGVTIEELERVRNGRIRELPGSYETAADVLNGLRNNAEYERPDNYQETLADRYREMTAQELDSAIRTVLVPDDFVWVVVGDATRVRSQLDALGLDVEVREAQ